MRCCCILTARWRLLENRAEERVEWLRRKKSKRSRSRRDPLSALLPSPLFVQPLFVQPHFSSNSWYKLQQTLLNHPQVLLHRNRSDLRSRGQGHKGMERRAPRLQPHTDSRRRKQRRISGSLISKRVQLARGDICKSRQFESEVREEWTNSEEGVRRSLRSWWSGEERLRSPAWGRRCRRGIAGSCNCSERSSCERGISSRSWQAVRGGNHIM